MGVGVEGWQDVGYVRIWEDMRGYERTWEDMGGYGGHDEGHGRIWADLGGSVRMLGVRRGTHAGGYSSTWDNTRGYDRRGEDKEI